VTARRCECATVLVLVLIAGCSGASQRPPLRPLELPAMSVVSIDVQKQIRERFSALEAAIARDDTSLVDLAAAYGDMGKLFTAAELYDAAETSFENASKLAPQDMRWPYYLGHVFRYRNDQPQAETWFSRALTLAPQHVPTLVWLAEMHLQQGRPGEAQPLLARARELDSASGAVLYGLGRAALAQNDFAAAVEHLEAALQRAPDATRLHYPLALAYRGLKQQDKADQHLRLRGEVDLLPADPLIDELRGLLQNASSFELRGSKAIEERRWDDAVADLRKAVELSPANAFTRLNLATSLYMSGNADAALDQYQQALRLSPSLARAHFGVGVIHSSRGQDAAAIRAFTAAIDADNAYTEARFSLGNALRRTGRIQEALAHYDAVRAADPAFSQASFGYTMGLVRLGRYRDARDRLEADVRAYPGQPGFAHALARVLAAAPDASVRDGRRALTIVEGLMQQERSPSTGETMAMALAEVGRFDEAAGWQRDVLRAAQQAGRAEMIPRLTANLRLYERKQPCREPWAADDPVHRPQ
jgi:tetratricopeptide (TPR) repeat protein